MAPLILSWSEIQSALDGVDLVATMETAFCAYSQGDAVIPPVAELQFDTPPGDVHIKYGYRRGGSDYVVKIASGFYDNPALGLASSQGVMLLFSQQTGVLSAVLLDDGRLTDMRTGAAGAVAARHLAPKGLDCIGVLGTGIQAREQVAHLRSVTACRTVVAWGRDARRLEVYLAELETLGFCAHRASSPADVAGQAQLIITTTPATAPLVSADVIRPGTHITAVGSDTADKQELPAELLARADVVVADSLAQSASRGEIYQAVASGLLSRERVCELGDVISGRAPGRQHPDQVSVVDLTGIAIQDLEISAAVVAAARAQ